MLLLFFLQDVRKRASYNTDIWTAGNERWWSRWEREAEKSQKEVSRVTHRWVQWHMTHFTEKVRVRRQRPRGRGGQWKGRTVGSHVVWSQPSFSQGSWLLPVHVLYKSRMDTDSSTQSSSQVARHRCSYDPSTHSPWSLPGRFGGSWLVRLQGHRRCLFYMWDREVAGTLATKPAGEREKWTFLQGILSGNLQICLHWPVSPLFWEAWGPCKVASQNTLRNKTLHFQKWDKMGQAITIWKENRLGTTASLRY